MQTCLKVYLMTPKVLLLLLIYSNVVFSCNYRTVGSCSGNRHHTPVQRTPVSAVFGLLTHCVQGQILLTLL